MKASSSEALPRLLHQLLRRADCQHLAGVHHRDAVAALGLVHEMGGEEDGHAVVARQVDQRAPEAVARDRVDARGRLVEDQHVRLVQHRDGELQALPDAERQAVGPRVGDGLQVEALEQLRDATVDLVRRQMVELRVELADSAGPSVRCRARRPATCSRHGGASPCRRRPSACRTAWPCPRSPAAGRSASSSSSTCRSRSSRGSRRSRRARCGS